MAAPKEDALTTTYDLMLWLFLASGEGLIGHAKGIAGK